MTAMPRNNLRRNADYWAQRMKNMEDALLDQSYSYVENLDAQFRAAEAEIERQMSAWYRRFAANNDITLADAKRLLNSDELAEFRWTVEDYIKHGEENALTGAWMKELENASARVHISRLDALKIQLQQQAELLYSNQLDYIDRAGNPTPGAFTTRPMRSKRAWAWAGPCRPSMRGPSPRSSPGHGPRTARLSGTAAGPTSRAL